MGAILALRSSAFGQPELHQQLVQIEPIGLTEDGADTILSGDAAG